MAAHQRLFSEIHSMQLFMRKLLTILCLIPLVTLSASAQCLQLLFATVDINIGETRHVELPDGSDATVKLIAKDIDREVAGAIHAAHVEVRMNDQTVTLGCGTYNLPVTAGGVQIDCGVVDDYIVDATSNYWALDKDARLRVWPEDSPWIRPDTYGYPLDQRIFASATHFSNEPAGYRPGGRFYYHAALDFGGAETMDTVFATTDGLVVSARNELMDAHREPVATDLGAGRGARDDVVYIEDERGWYHRYSHLYEIFDNIDIGERVELGEPIGTMGKRSSSGGYTHLHYEISSPMPSGGWGTHHAYPFVWQTYRSEHEPDVIAVARPHHTIPPGGTVTLDASTHSWAANGIAEYEWTLTDASTVQGPTATVSYDEPGVYTEIVKVTDTEGNVDYDFARIAVPFPSWSSGIGGGLPNWKVERGVKEPGLHAAFYPTRDLKVDQEITFFVRARGTTHGVDVWDFGDGSPNDTTKSNTDMDYHATLNEGGYATTTHRYDEPGHYTVTVKRTNQFGTATMRLHVPVGIKE